MAGVFNYPEADLEYAENWEFNIFFLRMIFLLLSS